MMPRKGDRISVLPYGPGIVERMLSEGRCLVTVDRMLKTKSGGVSNQVIVELHPVWIVAEVVDK